MAMFLGSPLGEPGRDVATSPLSPIISPFKLKILNFAPYCSPNQFMPHPTEGFAYASVDERFYVFGGSDLSGKETNDLYVFTLKSGWQKIDVPNDAEKPSPRVASAMTAYNQKLYLFGGINEKQGWLNDFYEFDTGNGMWKRLSTDEQHQNGSSPSPRDKCSLIASKDKIFLYGGFGPRQRNVSNESGNDSSSPSSNGQKTSGKSDSSGSNGNSASSTGTETESSCSSGDGKSDADVERELLAAMESAQSQQLGAEFDYYNDFYCFDLFTGQWSPVDVDIASASPTSAGNGAQRANPPGLAAYTVGALADKLLYFGGKTSLGERTNMVYCFALGLKKWLPLNVRNDSRWPVARSFHSSVVINDRHLITFGGRDAEDWERDDLWVLDMNTMQWMMARCEGVGGVSAPCARYGHALAVLPDADSRQHLVIYGGSAELDPASGVAQDVLTDMYIVPIDELVQACAPVFTEETAEEKEIKHQHHSLHHRKANPNDNGGSSNDEPTPSKVPRCDDCIDL